MSLMDRNTGQDMTDFNHVRQSIVDILTTPLGTRPVRRDYGCRLFDLVDAPINANNVTAFYIAIAEALDKWEPRIRVTKIGIDFDRFNAPTGVLSLTLDGLYLPNNSPLRLEGIDVEVRR